MEWSNQDLIIEKMQNKINNLRNAAQKKLFSFDTKKVISKLEEFCNSNGCNLKELTFQGAEEVLDLIVKYEPNKHDEVQGVEFTEVTENTEENIGMINGIVAEWITEISEKIDAELFKEVLVICTYKGKLYFDFLKGIINNWLQKNVTSYEELKSFELQNRIATNSVSKNSKSIQNSYKMSAGEM
ncbi:DnaD domain protein [Terrisporobacter petrolearius]|uniref:DnaD domain-containing protein n=1 Tax=Terrisporobacter petrolearius TaxID=1460447 RepID=UPI001D16CCBC|nr:DnaD domain protein [Terrisporobacter petrolearius]MCC3864177.1 DnaD domain protein [Terrisporobacter petrolearius]